MTETGLIIGQAVFLLLLFIFIGAVVRASVRALRTAEIEVLPPDPDQVPAKPAVGPTAMGASAARFRPSASMTRPKTPASPRSQRWCTRPRPPTRGSW